FGYDVKNAAHLVRLLRMGVESMLTGELQVRRPDAAELIEIKSGKWPLDKVVEEAQRLFAEVKRIEDIWADGFPAKLRSEPDRGLVNALMIDGYLKWWKK
ncbi:MAG: hypothetical protein ACRD3J_25235, partial [Thermoanaerobaculia bacterium]